MKWPHRARPRESTRAATARPCRSDRGLHTTSLSVHHCMGAPMRQQSNGIVYQSIEAEAPTGSKCEHGGGPWAEEAARPATSKHGPHAAHEGNGG